MVLPSAGSARFERSFNLTGALMAENLASGSVTVSKCPSFLLLPNNCVANTFPSSTLVFCFMPVSFSLVIYLFFLYFALCSFSVLVFFYFLSHFPFFFNHNFDDFVYVSSFR